MLYLYLYNYGLMKGLIVRETAGLAAENGCRGGLPDGIHGSGLSSFSSKYPETYHYRLLFEALARG